MEPRVLDDKEINLSINRICNTRFQDIGPTELESMKHLFENHIFMEVFHLKCSEFSRAFHYLAHNLSQYMDLNYAVTDEDILRVRMKTTGIHYYNIPVSGKRSWCFIDVGGQKSERRKWIHAFDDVLAVVYVSSLDYFDMLMDEDPSRNRLDDDVELFSSLIVNPYLPDCWIFFQNKFDVFQSKIENSDLKRKFPELGEKALDINFALEWHKNKFHPFVPERREIFWHQTCALDKAKMRVIIDSITHHMLASAISTFPEL
eukprot:TRINITY_DN1488_c0_g2_i1.p1 TRINITY_DN1488_c0_g2~~TRINITY_DN1488_c0_g2_i1.p1  ORF type:complete len:260 (+),score=47.97 TRINITY_DN1488_c0_g2_i1:371-1150(+)